MPAKGKRTPEQEEASKALDEEIKRIGALADAEKLKAHNVVEQQTPYRVFGRSLDKVPRDIVYSFCQYGFADVWEWGASLGGNSWRTTGDIKANWKSMSGIGFDQDRLAKYAGPGHWNDPDMLEIGNKGLTPDECYTHMTLWCMLNAPLLIGCDMSKMDPFTVSLFSNDEVLAVNQDALGKQGYRLKAERTSEVWVKLLADGGVAIAFFNRGEDPADIRVSTADLPKDHRFDEMEQAAAKEGNGYARHLRDLWRQSPGPEDALDFGGTYLKMKVAPHGAELLILGPPDPSKVFHG